MTDNELKRLIEGSAAETRKHFDTVAAELREENAETRQRLDAVAEELRQELGAVAEGLRQELGAVAAETRRHFDVVAEGFRDDVKGVADGYLTVSQRVDRLAEEMDDRFSETNAELKLVSEAVARVITILETEDTGVLARIDKLEARR